MKLFVTGGTGFIGAKVIELLLKDDHEVVGLARSDSSAKKLKEMGVKEVVKGELTDIDLLVDAAKKCDGTLNIGFIHDFSDVEKCLAIDKAVIENICNAYINTNKVFMSCTGTLSMVGADGIDEDAKVPENTSFGGLRTINENICVSYAKKGVRSMSIRFAPTVHGEGDTKFINGIINLYKQHGIAVYPGDGSNVWPAVHKDDSAVAVKLAAEKAPAGSILIVAAETGVSSKAIAEAAAKKHNLKLESVTPEKMMEILGPFMGTLFSLNNPISNDKTKKVLGWEPKEIGLIEDIALHY